ncbi:MAG: Flp family type IVb pilin [Sedimentisphaerales bacterium]|jgi:pilus assembly protein Flp/PilA
MELVKRFIRDEQGLETVEYAIILGLIVVGTITAIATIGNKVKNSFTNVSTTLP